MRPTTSGPRLNELVGLIFLLIGAAGDLRAAPPQGQPSNQPTIQGRLLDEDKKPMAGVTLSPCESAEDSGGSVGAFFTADANGSLRAASVKEPGSSERVFFAQYKNGSWATARTQEDGRFVFDGELALGTYCLAADSTGGSAPQKLKSPSGEPIKFELSAKAPKADLGDVLVKR